MKFSTLLIAAGLLCISVHITAQPHSRKKVGIVLSGGGAKGMAHIGALKVIEKAGIPIDYVVGTSMGSIIGGLYSIGYTPEQLDSMVRRQDWTFLLSDKIPRSEQNMAEREASSIRKRCQNTSHRRIDKGTKLGKPVQRADRRIS